jgi:leucyl aminopeptidase
MSLYKVWTQEKCPSYKLLKSKDSMSGDLFIVSDQKNYILEHAAKYLEKWQSEDLKKNIKNSEWTYITEKLTIHFYLHTDLKDMNVGGFESCKYYGFKKVLGQRLSQKQDTFNLIIDPKFKEAESFVQAFAEGICSISYNYKNKKAPELKINLESQWHNVFKNSFLKAEAVNLARFLVDLPPNELNPTTYAAFIKEVVGTNKNYKFESISKDLESKGYGLIHAVGKGSKNPPQLVRVISAGTGKKVALVGKGITFDTGGLDLKPSKFMRNMKKDMGGSAVVASILYYLVQSKQSLDIDFYFAIAENSMDGDSFRPGDVCTAGNGLTVEIDNTDAEGRLVLADALSWLAKEKKQPEIVIDIATLTGAIKVGLGSHIGGLFSNDKKLSDEIFNSSLETGDFVWPMPMPFWSESEMTKTDVADLVNSSQAGYGGAITAAQFLKFFVPKNTKWAHLDIYAWVDGKRDVIRQTGGSGQGVMLLIDWIERR